MKLLTRLLVGTVIAFSFCPLLQAQESPVYAPIAVQASPSVAIQTFAMESNGEPISIAVPVAMPGGTYIGGYSGGNLNLLHDPSVMKDLELVTEQMDKLADIRKEFNKRVQSEWKQIAKAQSNNDPERVKKLQQDLRELMSEKQEELSSVLLPHQLDRIKQVNRQTQMQMFGGASGALQHGQLAKEMKITDAQKKKLAEIQRKMNEDIALKNKEIRDSAKKQAMKVLTNQQTAKFKELTGEEFKRNPADWQEHRQRTLARNKKE